MRAPSPRVVAVAVVAAALLLIAVGRGTTAAAFRGAAASEGNTVTAARDWTPPTVVRAVVRKAEGGEAGYLREGAAGMGYAHVTDSGNPASGVTTVTANAGVSPVSMSGGGATIDGQTYGWNSPLQTAPAPLAEGTYPVSFTVRDADGNVRTQASFSFIVDNTAPLPAGIATANGGTIAGRPEAGDTVSFTFSEPIDRASIKSDWQSGSISAVVRIDNNAASGGNDRLRVYDASDTTVLRLGTINLGRSDYVTTNRRFGGTGVASTVTRSGATVTVTLGSASGAGTTAAATAAMAWAPDGNAYDRAGNRLGGSSLAETGTVDKEF